MISELFAVWCDLICELESAQAERIGSASVQPYRNHVVAPLFASKEIGFAYISTSGKGLQMCYYTWKTYTSVHFARILDMCSIL